MLLIRFSAFFICFLFSFAVSAQTFTPKKIAINSGTNGFYEYLPQGYGSGNDKYSLIIFLHGLEDVGNGDTDLDNLLSKGLPKVINDQQFPNAFTVTSTGQLHKFIVLCPQFINDSEDQPTPAEVNDIVNYAIANYRINRNRIYITGLSLGGGATWEYVGASSTYANRIAAIVPVAGFSSPTTDRATIIGNADVAVWATHNNQDPIAQSSWTVQYVDLINEQLPDPLAKKTIFAVSGHEGWTTTYDPTFKEDGLNVYEWMLQFQRTIEALPVSLTDYKASATENGVTINWTTTSELNNAHFTIERSANGVDFTSIGKVAGVNRPNNYSYIDNNPVNGDNFYRLSQTDIDGRATYYGILKVTFNKNANKGIVIYPNPATNGIQLELNNEENGSLYIYLINTVGAVVKQWTVNKTSTNYQQQISLIGLPTGVYTIQVKGKSFHESLRLVKN